MTQDRKSEHPSQQDPEQDNAMAGRNKSHPRPELGLKSVVEESKYANEDAVRQEGEGQKATQFDDNPNPGGAPSTSSGPKDDAPTSLGNESQNN